jgi:glycosyl-4,4'-diaponeurosporenoate acyltransferase
MRFAFLSGMPKPLSQFCIFAIMVIVIGMASLIIGELIPRDWYKYDKFPFASYKWEKNGTIYAKLGVHYWKDSIPDATKILKPMFKKRLDMPRSPEHIKRLLVEMCNGEVVHATLMIISPVFLISMDGWYSAAAVVIYFFVNLLYTMIQRYNRPRLLALLNRLEMKKKGEVYANRHNTV